jgi:hypothetical protein
MQPGAPESGAASTGIPVFWYEWLMTRQPLRSPRCAITPSCGPSVRALFHRLHHPCHIYTRNGRTPCHICIGTRLAQGCHICTGTGLAPPTSAALEAFKRPVRTIGCHGQSRSRRRQNRKDRLQPVSQSRCRCGQVPVQMWASPGADVGKSRCRCGQVPVQMCSGWGGQAATRPDAVRCSYPHARCSGSAGRAAGVTNEDGALSSPWRCWWQQPAPMRRSAHSQHRPACLSLCWKERVPESLGH